MGSGERYVASAAARGRRRRGGRSLRRALTVVTLALAGCGGLPDPTPDPAVFPVSKEETPEGWEAYEYPVPGVLCGAWRSESPDLDIEFLPEGVFRARSSRSDGVVLGAYRVSGGRLVLHTQLEGDLPAAYPRLVVFVFSSSSERLHLLRTFNSASHPVFPEERDLWLRRERAAAE